MPLNKVWKRKCWWFALKILSWKIWVEKFESKILSEFKLNKTKMVRSLKIKFLIISKLNFNEGQIYKKISNFDYFKNWKFFSYIKVGIENGEKVRRKIEIKFWVEKTLDDGRMDGWVGGSQSWVKDCLQQ